MYNIHLDARFKYFRHECHYCVAFDWLSYYSCIVYILLGWYFNAELIISNYFETAYSVHLELFSFTKPTKCKYNTYNIIAFYLCTKFRHYFVPPANWTLLPNAAYTNITILIYHTLARLYAFFWVIPRRLNFIRRRFGTLCSIFIGM